MVLGLMGLGVRSEVSSGPEAVASELLLLFLHLDNRLRLLV